VSTGLLLLNSCKTENSGNENDSGATVNSNKVEMIKVEGGNFVLHGHQEGSELISYKVALETFFIGKYEITQSQWNAIRESD
jgi:formylglycine-generating enzyme required for sulfatase activity